MSEFESPWHFDLTLIIVSWNVRDYLHQCLQSIEEKAGDLRIEIIVFDNASTDGTVDMLNADFPGVGIIASDQNLGFGRGNNLAFASARGRFIGLLNPDCVLLNDVFGMLVDILVNHPEVGLTGPKLLSSDNKVQYACARHFSTLSSEIRAVFGLGLGRGNTRGTSTALPITEYNNSQAVDCISGACMVMRREILTAETIFDPQYFMYAEDIDLCFETNQNGWVVYYASDARVLHYGSASSSQKKLDAVAVTIRSKHRFLSKRYGRRTGVGYLWLIAIVLTLKYAFASVLRFSPQPKTKKVYWAKQSERYLRMVNTARSELVRQ